MSVSESISRASRPSRFITALLAFLLGAFLAVGVAPAALAHDELLGSDPAAGSSVDALPAEIVLNFSGPVLNEEGSAEFSVTDSAGTEFAAGAPVIDGARVTQPLEGDAEGTVTVAWKIVSSDGHPVSETFNFTVGTAADVEPSSAPESPESDGASPWPIILGGGLVTLLAAGAVLAIALRKRGRTNS